MNNRIWDIAKKYRAGWLQSHLGFMEIFYEASEDRTMAEREFISKGFVVLPGTSAWCDPAFSKNVHRVFSSM